MTLIEQCQVWHENEQYKNIIDTLENMPKEDLTPELVGELARAYNNFADVNDSDLYKKAISLLESVKDFFYNEHFWHFRMGFAYYYLNQEGIAKSYFEKALELMPEDKDTIQMIEECKERLSLPIFEKNFRERTIDAWNEFEKNEKELRYFLNNRDNDAAAEFLIGKCSDILSEAFDDISFELGFNGEKYELILTPEGDKSKIYELVYFQRHTPDKIKKYWNIVVGRQPACGFTFRVGEYEISEADVKIYVEKAGRKSISLKMYCEKILPIIRENEHKALWMMAALTDQIIGEIPSMALISSFEVEKTMKEYKYADMSELPAILNELGLGLVFDPQEFLDNSYMIYEIEPVDDPEAEWRLDAYIGVSRCESLIQDYLQGIDDTMDLYHKDGVAAGFFSYPISVFADSGEYSKEVLNFRDELESYILKNAGEDAVTFIGGATGIYCGYLDFIAWDLQEVLKCASEFFKSSCVEWANFHTFRRGINAVIIHDRNIYE